MTWVDTDYQDFTGAAADPLPGFTTEAFVAPWVRDGSGNARGGEAYGTSTVDDIEAGDDRMAVETALPPSAPSHWLLIHSNSPPSAYDATRVVAGPELYYNGVYQGGYWGGGTADESLRIEDDGAGGYDIFVDGVLRVDGAVPTQTPGVGQNYGGMRGSSADAFTDLRVQEWDSGGGGSHFDEDVTTTVTATTVVQGTLAASETAATDVSATTPFADVLAAQEDVQTVASVTSTLVDTLADEEMLDTTVAVATWIDGVAASVDTLDTTINATTTVADSIGLGGEVLDTVVLATGDVLDSLTLDAELLVTLVGAATALDELAAASEPLLTTIISTTGITATVPDPRGVLSGSSTSTGRSGRSSLLAAPSGGSVLVT